MGKFSDSFWRRTGHIAGNWAGYSIFGEKGADARRHIIQNARADAINEMIDRAKKVGANALIGVSIDVEPIGGAEKGYMLMVTASGTAVVVDE